MAAGAGIGRTVFAHADSRLVFRRMVVRLAVTPDELSEELSISVPQVTRILDDFAKSGLAVTASGSKRGSILFSPTVSGMQLYRQCNSRH